MSFWRKLRWLSPAWRRAQERDMQEELDSLAAIASRRELGNLTLAAENARAAWGWRWLDGLLADARYAWRVLARQPSFTLVAVASLALGIGANAAIFSLMDTVLWRNLPVSDPARLVRFNQGSSLCYLAYARYAEQGGRVMESVFGESGSFTLPMDAGGGPQKGSLYLVTGNYFEALGVSALVGRTLSAEDDRRSEPQPAVMLSYRYWQRAFAGDPAVAGRSLRVGNARFTVVGVAPPEFLSLSVGEAPDVWLPLNAQSSIFPGSVWQDHSNTNFLVVWGRLRAGVSREQAETALTATAIQIDVERNGRPETEADRKRSLDNRPGLEYAAKGSSPLRQFDKPLHVIFWMVGMVLLLACINVMSLQFARADERRRELTVRLAIGAGRARIVRQLLTESVLLALASGAAGLALCRPIAAGLLSIITLWGNQPVRVDLGIHWEVLLFVLEVSAGAALISGVLPALHATRGEVQPGLQAGAGAATASPVRRVLARSVASLQVALSLVLVAGTCLFAYSLHQARAFDAGINRHHLLVLDVDPAQAGYREADTLALNGRLRERLRAVPGVEAVSYSQNGIYAGRNYNTNIDVDGPHSTRKRDSNATYDLVGPGFFTAVGAHMLAGRDFQASDDGSGPRVAIVSQEFVRRVLLGGYAVGRTLYASDSSRRMISYRIVGVVGDIRNEIRRKQLLFYLCQPQTGIQAFSTRFLARTRIEPLSLISGLRAAVRGENSALRIDQVDSADDLLDATLSSERLLAALAWGFGALALTLAAVGIYGLLSYDVTRRTAEIGIRMAIGARRGDILELVLRQAALVCGIGLALGAAAALGLAHLVQGMVFGLQSGDPRLEASAALVLLLVALCAAAIPARRAARMDPMKALRHD
jgi:predicted permease